MDNGHNENGQRTKLLYSDLTYQLIGLLYKINDDIGFGQTEKVYCDAFEKLLKENGTTFKREYYSPITMDDSVIAKRYFDFLVEDKIIIEFKINDYKYKEVCSQLFGYLKNSGLKLGIIVRFTKGGVKIKRIPCFY
ncbi:MAG TPA: GxxExxY protein [bacterium]|nr:GxxExxY protein [bacterium]